MNPSSVTRARHGAGAVAVRIPTRGPFSLTELGTFGFGHLHTQAWDGVWRLAFGVDGGSGHAGVAVRQVAPQELELTIEAARRTPWTPSSGRSRGSRPATTTGTRSWHWGSTIPCCGG